MANDRMDLLELLRKATSDGDVDLLREGVRVLSQALMEAEVSAEIGAVHGERAPERRSTQRNGYRQRRWDTRVGSLDLNIPRLREGSYFPSLLEPRRRAERALLSVVQEAYVGGVSTRRVEDLVAALGITNLSRSEVSRICAALDTEVEAFRGRPLDATGHPYLWLDALYHKVREDGRVVNMATLIAIGVSAAGERSVLGVEVAAAGGDEGAHWLPFLRGLGARGLAGVKLVISDAHPGLTAAAMAMLAKLLSPIRIADCPGGKCAHPLPSNGEGKRMSVSGSGRRQTRSSQREKRRTSRRGTVYRAPYAPHIRPSRKWPRR